MLGFCPGLAKPKTTKQGRSIDFCGDNYFYSPSVWVRFKFCQTLRRVFGVIYHRSLSEDSCQAERVDKAYQTVGATQPGSATGTFAVLPLAQKVIDRITHIVDEELSAIDCQKVSLPLLCSAKPWKVSGRWDSYGQVLFRLQDRSNAPLCLGPTHEEAVTQCIAEIGAQNITPKLPLKLYQIGWKFRDEPRPKQGLLRSREFLMKDMYSFDSSADGCRQTYDEVTKAYQRIFSRIGLPFVRASASSGDMGGSHSHEYHYDLPVGEDRILECRQCLEHFNLETIGGGQQTAKTDDRPRCCPKCGGNLNPERNCVEVGHTFILGDVYSKKLDAKCIVDGKLVPLEMGCYGIGISRIISAAAEFAGGESLSLPISIAPFTVAVIGPKKGATNSDEEAALSDEIASELDKILPGSRVILDDRPWSIGRRLNEQHYSGTAFAVVVGKGLRLELHQFAPEKVPDRTEQQRSRTEEPQILTDKSSVYDYFNKLRQRLKLT